MVVDGALNTRMKLIAARWSHKKYVKIVQIQTALIFVKLCKQRIAMAFKIQTFDQQLKFP